MNFPRYYASDVVWYTVAEPQTKKFFHENMKDNFHIIDAGAQIGMYTAFFSKFLTNGRVYAFEPTDTISMLQENLKYNECTANVELFANALGNLDGKHKDKVFKIWSQGVIDEREFDFIKIDTFVKTRNLNIDMIKIDVDSYDYEVLLGMKETLVQQKPIVVVEVNDRSLSKRGYNSKHILNYMSSMNYEIKHILDDENYVFIPKQGK